jgi:NADPH:quinone reductase-like Zn-dependent oxidoreductase
MVLPAAAAMPVPPGWTEEQALGLVVNWPTALAALKPLGGVIAGQTVLVHAAAGATGQAAVTLAKHYGATVIATASLGKHETALALGADHVLDARGGDIAAEVLRLTAGAGADVVLESAGGSTFDASWRADPGRAADLRRGHGRVVRTHRRRCADPRPTHRIRAGRRPEDTRGTGSQGHHRETGPAALSRFHDPALVAAFGFPDVMTQ